MIKIDNFRILFLVGMRITFFKLAQRVARVLKANFGCLNVHMMWVFVTQHNPHVTANKNNLIDHDDEGSLL